MKLKFLKPTTSSQRQVVRLNRNFLNKKPFLKTEIKGMKSSAGRNNSGKITVFHKGGGNKKRYRKINFNRVSESTGIVCSIEYDPNRTANIASVYDLSKNFFFYMLSPINLKIGDIVKSGTKAEYTNSGNSLPLYAVPEGNIVYNVSIKPFKSAQISRAAGTFSRLEEKKSTIVKLRLTSGKQKFVSLKNYATIGIVSNEFNYLVRYGKAGKSRWLGIRPTVRGVAMNPIDHPNGGGEGRKSGKRISPWGKVS